MMASKKDSYLDEQICLKYPTVDKLVEIIIRKGKGCLLFKCDLRRFYRQIPVCPKDYNKLGMVLDNSWYFDKVLVMGCRSSCYIAQRITNAISFILQEMKVDNVNYLDDLGGVDVPESATQSFDKMGKLLNDLNIEESTNKACSPNSRMLFLGIIIDTNKMSLELDAQRLSDSKTLLENWNDMSRVNIKQVQSLVGVLSFAASCIRQGRPFFSRILNFLREMPSRGYKLVPDEVKKDIVWWKNIAPC